MTLIEALKDLHHQATIERSHYYTGNLVKQSIARIEALEQALREIAQQKLSDELDEHEREWADYHDGWDQAVKCARAVLVQTGEPIGSPPEPDALAWQPIETAPKDGTVVDLWGTDWEGKAERWTNAR